MCGRMILATPLAELARLFGFEEGPDFPPRYNLAPTQLLPVIRLEAGAHRRLDLAAWGLVPSWAKDAKGAARMINARAETVAEKPAFRSAFRKRRCLVPADGFYEWKSAGRTRKQPYLIRSRDRAPFAFAGLWEVWRDPTTGSQRLSATIVTTTANAAVEGLHDRMPVILDRGAYQPWLDPDTDLALASDLLRPCPPDMLEVFPVDPRVGNPRHDDPGCIAPLVETPALL